MLARITMTTAAATFFSFLLAVACASRSHAVPDQQHLHFYMNDDYAGPHPSAMLVVSGKPHNATTPRQFGDIVVCSNSLTSGPGLATSDLSMLLVMADGSGSVAVKGRVDLVQEARESTVIGGAGRFRGASGRVVTRDYGEYDLAKGEVVVIDVYLEQ